MALLEFKPQGIYCPQADVYIDPWRPVERALITHGHSDHARWGHKYYLCTELAAPVIQYRLGAIKVQTVKFGQITTINGVEFSFHPAGHILGSAQIKASYKGETWGVSGDYKLEKDAIALPFEPFKCHAYITESTFGLPVYKWKDPKHIFDAINTWWQQNKEEGKVSVLSGYSLGKAQRIIQGLNPAIGKIYTHGAVENINKVIRAQGISLHPTINVTPAIDKKDFIGNIVIAPPAAIGSSWMKRFKPVSVGVASGWMTLRGARRRRAVDRGFILSDHADWDGLMTTIKATEAQQVFVTHGYTKIFKRWLIEQGLDAQEVKTEFEGELSEMSEVEASEGKE